MTEIRINSLKYDAIENSEEITSGNELNSVDKTEQFYNEIPKMLQNGERININFNGQTTSGKSTASIALLMHIYQVGKELGLFKLPLTIRNIARDQQEASKIFRDPNISNTIIMCDEWSVLADSGENSTVEMKLWQYFSDVMAQRYIHMISCSPKSISDPNSDIFLEVIQADKEKMITHCHLYYNLFKAGTDIPIKLGYVNIDVSNLVKRWTKIMPLFFKHNKTKEEEAKLQNARKKDFYIEYMIKKHEKMDLLTKEGIFRPRLLDYADIILPIIEEMAPLMRLSNIINNEVVRNYVKSHCKHHKIPLTILGEQLMTGEIMGTLKLYQGFYRTNAKINKLKDDFKKMKIQQDEYAMNSKMLEDLKNQLYKAIEVQKSELQKLKEIKEKYNQFVSS